MLPKLLSLYTVKSTLTNTPLTTNHRISLDKMQFYLSSATTYFHFYL